MQDTLFIQRGVSSITSHNSHYFQQLLKLKRNRKIKLNKPRFIHDEL